ncbi:aminotransferase class I/II-fold pyridoxal phosphate-dependent enzyme [Parvibaculum sedimenti]|uniref:Aminotransferase class I/II-fold pyridoxal phosphate-dependent enzyme n=1 Tax=Parvibaculum sedimenti TaxID=2608632 RepID=A0A6N6VFT9_9HYPH|nr:aminotransferase class I/II-fold pyridoxal phosphate-dependent enzyme [Parvibaculum sedimenti]
MRTPLSLDLLAVDPQADTPLYRQLYDALRGAILEGRLTAGGRLPSSRRLAADLGVGRNTVLSAYEQLAAEGYLEGQIGAGTRIASSLPDNLLEVGGSAARGPDQTAPANPNRLSRRGETVAAIRRPGIGYERGQARAFQHGLPAVDQFPAALWSRLLGRRTRDPRNGLFGYETGAGYAPLREAIAAHAGAARGVICTPDQVIVTTGAQAALDLASRMLIDPEDAVWIEEPGYLGARAALLGAGARLMPVPVDGEGLDVAAGIALEPAPRLIYVTPSHQYPLGVTLSLPRRLALLDFARRADAWVIEDDYDSEYRYAGRPLASLQGLDRATRVLYMGTFSKTLFPGLKVGYLIVPDALVDAFRAAIRLTGHVPAPIIQAALAEFIGEGHFGAHVRRMRTIYAARRAALIDAAERELVAFLELTPCDGGMQLVGCLRDGLDDRHASALAAAANIHVAPLAPYYLGKPSLSGLHMGFAGIPEAQIARSAKRLAVALAEMAP